MQNTHKLTDDQLVSAYSNGNNEAFDTLLNRHQQRIYSYILRLVKDNDLANDFFQETFVKAIMNIKQGRYSGDGKFSAWITRIAHNLIIDHFRQEQSTSTVSTDNAEADILNRREFSEGTIEDMIVDQQILSDVKSLVACLPREQREIVDLRFYQGLSFKEIAERTDVSINTALGRMRYAILNLRRLAKESNIVLTR